MALISLGDSDKSSQTGKVDSLISMKPSLNTMLGFNLSKNQCAFCKLIDRK